MKHCPHCNQPVPRGTGTCPECGKPLKRTAPQPSEQPAAPFEIPQHLTANGKKTAAAIMVILAVITIIALAIFLTIMGDMIRRRSRYSNRQPRNGYITTAPGSGDSGSTETQSASEITFLDSEVTKDVFRNDVLVVRIRYQNNEEKNMHFVQKYRIQVFQDGVSCQETMLDTDDESVSCAFELQPGASVVIKTAFLVDPAKTSQLIVGDYQDTFRVLDMEIAPAPELASTQPGI